MERLANRSAAGWFGVVGFLAVLVLTTACDKAPDLSKIPGVGGSKNDPPPTTSGAAAEAPVVAAESPVPSKAPAAAVPAVDPVAFTKAFFAKPTQDISEGDLATLAQLPAEHRAIRLLNLSGAALSESACASIGKLTDLEELNLSNCSGLTAGGLAQLAGCKRLQRLVCVDCSLEPSSAASLRPLVQLTALDLSGASLNDADLATLASFPSLTRLTLNRTDIADAGLKSLAQSKSLTLISLRECSQLQGEGVGELAALVSLAQLDVSHLGGGGESLDAGLNRSTSLPNLEALNVSGCKITANTFLAIARLPKLQNLTISENNLNAEACKVINSSLSKLTELHMDDNPIGDQGLFNLVGLKQVGVLSMRKTQLTAEGMPLFKRYPKLRRLNICDNGISDLGIAPLRSLTGLEALNISVTQISDQGLVLLKGMSRLSDLRIYKNGVTDAGLMQLAGLKNINTLSVGETGCTAASIRQFKNLQRLEGFGLSSSEIDALRQQFPNLQTDLDWSGIH